MEETKKILLEYLANNNWNADSINEVKEKIQDFKGIVAIKNRAVLFSESKDWRTDKSRALSILKTKAPKAIFFEIGFN